MPITSWWIAPISALLISPPSNTANSTTPESDSGSSTNLTEATSLFPKVIVGSSHPTSELGGLGTVDHGPYDRLLARYVDPEGRVDYDAWKANSGDRRALTTYLERAGQVDLLKPTSQRVRLAYWLNLYNALTLEGLLREYPTGSIRDHANPLGYNIWRDLLIYVGDQTYSLDQIEHDILRPMQTPEIHMGLVCGSNGCPPLRPGAYSPKDIEQSLADNARAFLARPENFGYDAQSGTLHLSKIFQWYGSDFGATREEQLRAIAPYLPKSDDGTPLDFKNIRIQFRDYDWSLNTRNDTQGDQGSDSETKPENGSTSGSGKSVETDRVDAAEPTNKTNQD